MTQFATFLLMDLNTHFNVHLHEYKFFFSDGGRLYYPLSIKITWTCP